MEEATYSWARPYAATNTLKSSLFGFMAGNKSTSPQPCRGFFMGVEADGANEARGRRKSNKWRRDDVDEPTKLYSSLRRAEAEHYWDLLDPAIEILKKHIFPFPNLCVPSPTQQLFFHVVIPVTNPSFAFALHPEKCIHPTELACPPLYLHHYMWSVFSLAGFAHFSPVTAAIPRHSLHCLDLNDFNFVRVAPVLRRSQTFSLAICYTERIRRPHRSHRVCYEGRCSQTRWTSASKEGNPKKPCTQCIVGIIRVMIRTLGGMNNSMDPSRRFTQDLQNRNYASFMAKKRRLQKDQKREGGRNGRVKPASRVKRIEVVESSLMILACRVTILACRVTILACHVTILVCRAAPARAAYDEREWEAVIAGGGRTTRSAGHLADPDSHQLTDRLSGAIYERPSDQFAAAHKSRLAAAGHAEEILMCIHPQKKWLRRGTISPLPKQCPLPITTDSAMMLLIGGKWASVAMPLNIPALLK
ncbi:hypothetical protein GEV33_010300 [Tenebrio molitor]|uniref:Uncharacterized protein n=1 Tax=Tenebrio molitor TaxID=7067 RepID=A0A8J6HE83_TENMO|nr:hypothetical protein GEV33_010300 [Tenebrio molitor]